MQEKKNIHNNNNKNISKKKSENIKIPKKLAEKIKDNSYLSANNSNINNNNKCSNYYNNSILMNKSNVKIDINKNYQKPNLRSISHSTKCMMKIKDRYKDKEKYQHIIKYNNDNNKHSLVKDTNKKSSKDKKSSKIKQFANSKDNVISKNNNNYNNYDINNHSFNYFRKSQNTNNNSNNNTSTNNNNNNYSNINNSSKNIESSCYSDFYNTNKNINSIPKIKKKDNIIIYNVEQIEHKNNFKLPFYYCTKKDDKKYNSKKKTNYSDKTDYNYILQNLNIIPTSELAAKIASLTERKWLYELKENLALLEKNKSINFDNNILNAFIKGRLALQEDFNWLLWGITYVYKNKIEINQSHLKPIEKEKKEREKEKEKIGKENNNYNNNKEGNNDNVDNSEIKINYNNIDDINNNLSINNFEKWKEGFIYNGVYFLLLDKIENYNEIKVVKREIKSLNLLFLDYIQLLDNIPSNVNETKPLLTNNMIFPLLNIADCSDFCIMASMAIEPPFINQDKNKSKNKNYNLHLNLNESYNENKKNNNFFNYYNEVNLSKYNLNNLKNSPFFSNLTENNLMSININLNNNSSKLNFNETKYLLVNIARDLHPLLIPKNIDNEEEKNNYNCNDYIFLKYPLITNLLNNEEVFYNKSWFLNYFIYFINFLANNKYITDMSSLEYEINKFGINKSFYLFILSRIKFNNSCDIETNNNISSLIKIYILVKLLTKIEDVLFVGKTNKNIVTKNEGKNEEKNNDNNNENNNVLDVDKENKSETSCGTTNAKNNANSKMNIRYNNTEKKHKNITNNNELLNTIYINFNELYNNKEKKQNKEISKGKTKNIRNTIKVVEQLILFILSPKSSFLEINIDDLVQKILYQTTLYLERFKKMSKKLFSNDVSTLYDAKSFLKSLIISARKNPLIFLRQIEAKFNILFNYQIKYVTSICLENFVKFFNVNQIIEKDPKIISYINGEELGFYLIIKNISLFHQKNKLNSGGNCFKKKGSKITKNSSSNNMEIFGINNGSSRLFGGNYNYDNLSLLNRSIIQPRNSNFKILNSSKDRPKIKMDNNIHLPTSLNLTNSCSNSNSNSKNKNLICKDKDKDKENNLLTCPGDYNNSCNLNNLNSLNSTNSIESKNNCNSYKGTQTHPQTQSNSSYKKNNSTNNNINNRINNTDNISLVDNFVIASSSKDMFEFNYGDEDSEKSFNISGGNCYGDSGSGFPISFNKKRNTANVNSSKFNLSSSNIANGVISNNRVNSSSNNNCQTINAKNYSTNINNKSNTNNIIINNKISNSNINLCLNNNMTQSCSSNMINNNNNYSQNGKFCFGNESQGKYWEVLFNNYHLKFPYNLYKVATQNSKASLLIYKYLSMYYSFLPFNNNNNNNNNMNNYNYGYIKNPLKDSSQSIIISEMLDEMKQMLENVFSDIISLNPKSCYILINFYIYYFINYYFIKDEQNKKSENVISKINHIFKHKILYKQNIFNIIINLLNVLTFDKKNFLKTDRYCNKALILSLIQYGEPRGRNNDGNNIMLFPVWKVGRNSVILDNNDILNENYKELYHCLFYLYESKRNNKSNSNLKDIKDVKLIDKSILNDLYRNIEYIKKKYKKSQKKKKDELYVNTSSNMNVNRPFHFNCSLENKKSSGEIHKNCKKKNTNSSSGTFSIKHSNINSNKNQQNQNQNLNEDTFFNLDDEDMIERPSKINEIYDEFFNMNENNNNFCINGVNTPLYSNYYNINNLNINNILNKTSFLSPQNYNFNLVNIQNNSVKNNNSSNNNKNNCKIIPMINPEYIFEVYFRENSTFPDIIFPSINEKRSAYINSFISSEKFFIYLFKVIFAIINYSPNEFTYTNEYLKQNIFNNNNNSALKFENNNNNNSSTGTSKIKKLSFFTKILSNNLYYKKYAQSNIIVSFGNNPHYETGHKGYKFLSLPRVLYQLKNKEIISIKSGWEHSIVQDKEKLLYSWGNNSCCQCGFDSNEVSNGNILVPKNISELNDKNIIEISCGNEHTLALSSKGEVYSWGSISDGVLGREIPKGKEKCNGLACPGIIDFFVKNNIKIRHISSGSIHNLCLDEKSNLYSFGCSKGGQLGLEENELMLIFNEQNQKQNQKKNNNNINNFSISEPRLIKSLNDIEIIKISSGEAHNAALSIDGKCYVWGFGSNGQLGLGFCEDYFPSGEGMKKSRIFTPTIIKEFEKTNNKITKIFCGKTFTIFLNKKDELFSTGINDLNQCGIDNKSYINEYLCYDIVTPIKIEMFIKMKIISVSCGESHVLAITEDNCIKTLFSWGSNRFGQLGQGIQTKQSMPKIVNYFLYYNNSEVFQVSCGAFHSLALLRSKNEENINVNSDEKYIFGLIESSNNFNLIENKYVKDNKEKLEDKNKNLSENC